MGMEKLIPISEIKVRQKEQSPTITGINLKSHCFLNGQL